jgi:ETC complex I subunit conserved region
MAQRLWQMAMPVSISVDPRPNETACSIGHRPGKQGMTEGRGAPIMAARIYKPTKTAMQSGTAKTKVWVLEYEPEEARVVEPLMGWTSSADMKQQVRLSFDTKEEAIAYAERHAIPYQVFEAKEPARRVIAYADNFAFSRRTPWTH